MMKWEPNAVLEALRSTAWPILRMAFAPNCCVAATHIGIAVLTRFGIAGHSTITTALGLNQAIRGWIDAGAVGEPPPDARFVDIDTEYRSEKGLPAHLVITGKVKGFHFFLDLSAPQFHRPEKGIHVPVPIYGKMPKPWPLCVNLELAEGGLLCYGPHPKPETIDYETSRDWVIMKDHSPRSLMTRDVYLRISSEMIAAVEAKLLLARISSPSEDACFSREKEQGSDRV